MSNYADNDDDDDVKSRNDEFRNFKLHHRVRLGEALLFDNPHVYAPI